MGAVLRNVGRVKSQPFKKTLVTKMGPKMFLKRKCVLWFLFSIQSSDYGATSVAKVSLFSTRTQSALSFRYVLE